ncbi:hypothetical protein ACFSFY_04820 [Sporosarcina siberiensis]|uniref:DUF4352 domain-containing protein n=1 Tax=Sporosarcina siberiensis TaxID=1365606 RepID=A0ABW4SFI8_9BACL
MKKINVAIILILMVSAMVILVLGNPSDDSSPKNVVFDGKTDGFDSLKELENGTSIIIRGTKLEEKRTEISRSEIDDEVNGGYTESIFKIDKVYKNSESNEIVKSSENISISELAYYDKKTNTTYHVNGYEKMTVGGEYLLFLIPVDNGMFSTRGVTFGKIPLKSDETEVNKDSKVLSNNSDLLNNIFKEAKAKYNNK